MKTHSPGRLIKSVTIARGLCRLASHPWEKKSNRRFVFFFFYPCRAARVVRIQPEHPTLGPRSRETTLRPPDRAVVARSGFPSSDRWRREYARLLETTTETLCTCRPAHVKKKIFLKYIRIRYTFFRVRRDETK